MEENITNIKDKKWNPIDEEDHDGDKNDRINLLITSNFKDEIKIILFVPNADSHKVNIVSVQINSIKNILFIGF